MYSESEIVNRLKLHKLGTITPNGHFNVKFQRLKRTCHSDMFEQLETAGIHKTIRGSHRRLITTKFSSNIFIKLI